MAKPNYQVWAQFATEKSWKNLFFPRTLTECENSGIKKIQGFSSPFERWCWALMRCQEKHDALGQAFSHVVLYHFEIFSNQIIFNK